jgi:hypothetical protein
MEPVVGFLTVYLPRYKQPPKIGPIPHKQTSNDARSTLDLQILDSTRSSSTPLMKVISLKILPGDFHESLTLT